MYNIYIHTQLGMVRVNVSRTISAPQDRMFGLISDFEKLPLRFPNRYRSVRIVEKSGNTVTVEEDVTVAGREAHQRTRHTVEPNSLLKSEVLDGDARGTVVEVRLAPDGAGTKVTVDADLKLGKLGAMLGMFAKGRVKEALERMIVEFEVKAQ
ncbi:MAG: SRPBCC family protein [Nitrososphaera sp.]